MRKELLSIKKTVAKDYKELGELVLKLNGDNRCLFWYYSEF